MSYHIYNTRGIILSSRPLREADRIYSILTRELGLLRATATGVRKEESKLRGHIEPISLSNVSLIRGKEYWRLTSAELVRSINQDPNVAKPMDLIEKLVQGEEANLELFDIVEKALLSDEVSEIKLVSNILYNLGYLKEEDLELDERSMVKAINEGLEYSQL